MFRKFFDNARKALGFKKKLPQLRKQKPIEVRSKQVKVKGIQELIGMGPPRWPGLMRRRWFGPKHTVWEGGKNVGHQRWPRPRWFYQLDGDDLGKGGIPYVDRGKLRLGKAGRKAHKRMKRESRERQKLEALERLKDRGIEPAV